MKMSLVLASLALGLPLLILLASLLLRFRFTLDWQFPKEAHFEASLNFLGLKKNIQSQLFQSKKMLAGPNANSETTLKITARKITNLNPMQKGFLFIPHLNLKIPSTLSSKLIRFKKHFRKAGVKFILERQVWKLVIVTITKIGKRIIVLFNFRFEQLIVGLKDVNTMAQIAAVRSALIGLFPRLQCPIEYRFCPIKPILKLRLRAEFTAFQFFMTMIAIVFTLPWIRLAKHFLHCWRNPLLNVWQRWLLLFLPA